MRVVIVDDNEVAQNFAIKILCSHQIDVLAFSNSIEALNYLTTHEPDAVLIDYMLPGGPDGLKLAAQVRRLYPACIIIMISAYAQIEDVVEAMRIGCDDFLFKKNLQPEELLNRIGSAVMQRKAWFPAPTPTRLSDGEMYLDVEAYRAVWYGAELTLTPTQFNVLIQLLSKPGHIFNYGELYARCTGIRLAPGEARSKLKTHIINLRQKLEQEEHPRTIWNVRGAGYKWEIRSEPLPDDG
ncbi:MAG: response regulator transcription factor [Chloroflexota bacterium]